MRLADRLAPALVVVSIVVIGGGCTLQPNVAVPNCKMTVTGVEPSAQGWVYCDAEAADGNLSTFHVDDGTGNVIVITAPGVGSFDCGKPNLEVQLQYNGALEIAGCDPVSSCTTVSGSCTVDITQFSTGQTETFAADVTAFAASGAGNSFGYNFTLSGSFTHARY